MGRAAKSLPLFIQTIFPVAGMPCRVLLAATDIADIAAT